MSSVQKARKARRPRANTYRLFPDDGAYVVYLMDGRKKVRRICSGGEIGWVMGQICVHSGRDIQSIEVKS